jgi:hypothetical protein
MTPQFVDFDFDGIKDIVVGTFEGTAFWLQGTKNGFKKQEYIKDSQDRNVQLSNFWNREEKKWDEADRSPEGVENPKGHSTSVVAVDWDGDKDLDLLLGAYYSGTVYVQLNEGTAQKPSYAGVNHRVKAGGEDISIPGGLCSMRSVDFDGDGHSDLICGSKKGGVYLYRNEGKSGPTQLAAPQVLIQPSGDKKATEASRPNSGLHIDIVDFDEDGDLDLLVGGYSEWTVEQPELTEEQQEAVVKAGKEASDVRQQLSKMFADVRSDPKTAKEKFKALSESPEYQKLMEKYQASSAKLRDLKPNQSQRKALVWLYRQNS